MALALAVAIVAARLPKQHDKPMKALAHCMMFQKGYKAMIRCFCVQGYSRLAQPLR